MPAAATDHGKQFSHVVDGLEVGGHYGFQVVPTLEGAEGTPSKKLEKSADGKHALQLLEKKKDDKAAKGGGKPAPGKPAAKIVAKTGGMTTQWDILRSMGLSAEEIPPFVDPVYWLRYFPPLGMVPPCPSPRTNGRPRAPRGRLAGAPTRPTRRVSVERSSS